MVYLIDDTFEIQPKRVELKKLFFSEFMAEITLIEKPKVVDLKSILKNPNVEYLLYHKSFQIHNDLNQPVFSPEIKRNFITKVEQGRISTVQFSGDIHTNFDAKTIDKSLMYSNLKVFLKQIVEKNNEPLKALFLGSTFFKENKKQAGALVMNLLSISKLDDLIENHQFNSALKIVFIDFNPVDLINDWKDNKLSNAQIFRLINEKL